MRETPMTTLRACALALLAAAILVLGLTAGAAAQEAVTPPAEAPPAATDPAPDDDALPPAQAPQEPAATPPADTVPPATATPEGSPAAPVETPAEPEKQPKLQIADPIRDLGRVQRGQRLEVVYVIENLGEAPLQIRNVQPSCGCTVASFDRQIAPAGKGELRAVIDTDHLEGALAKGITVISNDPVQPRTVLTLKLEVLSFVHVTPGFARLLQVQTMPPAATSVHLWATDGTPLELGAIETGADWIVARASRVEAAERREEGPAEQWRIDVSIAPGAPLGPLTDSIFVATSHPKQPRVEIPLSGFVRPVLSAQPTAADFGTLGRGADPKQFVLKLFNFGAAAVEVTSATTDLAFVAAQVEPDEPGRRFRIRLTLDPLAPKGKFEGKLRIATTSAEMPTLEVPVRGRVQ